jgi:glycosyltransferase involved in cell wall biosynthesis
LVGPYDLLHFPYDSGITWKRGKFVVTVHDVKPLLFDSPRPRRNLNSLVEQLVVGDKWSNVDRVVTDSESSRRDIVEHLKIHKGRVAVAYPGVDRELFRPAPTATADRGARPYVLCVAGSDPTKNVKTLIDAFAKLPRTMRDRHDLVLAGDFRRRPDLYERVRQAGIEKQTQFTGIVSDDRLKELYQRARLFVFPSRYEGFGLPVLEAMACGCPVISSNASSLPEVAGDAAILLDPMDIEGFTREMVRVMSDSDLRRDLRERGLARAAQFSWDRTARETIAVYSELLQ